MLFRCLTILIVAFGVVSATNPSVGQQPLVLRDMTLVRNDPIVSFDETGVVLQSQRRIRWSKIYRGQVAAANQAEFEKLLRDIGTPLFRLESRLSKKDWAGLSEMIEPIYASLNEENSFDPHTRFLVCVAAMHSRLYDGQRQSAVEPYLRATVILAQHKNIQDNPDVARFADQIDGSVSDALLPICFDRARAVTGFSKLNTAVDDKSIEKDATALVYLSSMAIAAENYGVADQLISLASGMVRRSSDPVAHDWISLIKAHRNFATGEIGRGRQLVLMVMQSTSVEAQRALGFYLLGSYCNLDSQEDQLLNLVAVPAVFGKRFPYLSAASIYQAVRVAKDKSDSKQSRILLNELLRTYPNTYHGRLAAIENLP